MRTRSGVQYTLDEYIVGVSHSSDLFSCTWWGIVVPRVYYERFNESPC